jgi:hydroxyacylglutathione hydrolase
MPGKNAMPHTASGVEIVTIPCLADNYAYLVHEGGSPAAMLIDAPDAAPIEAELEARGWSLDRVLITHHHNDHIAGVARLRDRFGCAVWGPAAEAARLPPLDRALVDGEAFGDGPSRVEVIAVPGHTLGHLAYHMPGARAAFTADSLMAGGCGRLFEGTAAEMWHSLSRLAALPPETLVCSGHEYTASNLRFAASLDPQNAALISRIGRVAEQRQRGLPTVPVVLAEELATSPFLRAGTGSLRRAVGLEDAPEVQVFGEIRARKDRF